MNLTKVCDCIKKFIALVLALVCVFSLIGCVTETKYKVEIADTSYVVNKLKKTYSPGEEVTLKLETITEHYYIVSVNGVKIGNDKVSSDLAFTYYTFTMPDEDVLVEIEDRWVEIPVAPQQ